MSVTKIVLLTLLSQVTFGAPAPTCPDTKTAQSVLKCIQAKHPTVQLQGQKVGAAQALEDEAGQIPNPEIGGSYVRGNNLGDVVAEAEVSLNQEIEIGGKRGARIDKAKAELGVAKSEEKATLQNVTIQAVVNLYRLRQINEEGSVLDEALHTYRKIQRQYKRRKTLSPELEVSLNVFQLAESDYQFQKESLEEERRHLEKFFKLSTGLTIDQVSKVAPKRKQTWPKVSEKTTGSPQNAEVLISKANLDVANAEVDVQKSLSWPNITVSPTYRKDWDGGVNFDSYGVGVSLPLPLWNLNGGGRARAYKSKAAAETRFRQSAFRAQTQRSIKVRTYTNSVKTLKSARTYKEVQRKHGKLERLFHRGVVSSPLVIEAHRQILDFLRSQNEHEIRALEALWAIYAIDGLLLKEEI